MFLFTSSDVNRFYFQHKGLTLLYLDEAVRLGNSLGGVNAYLFATQHPEGVGSRFLPDLADSFREVPGGWTLAFDPRDMMVSQEELNGDHWADWLATDCPALLMRGRAQLNPSPVEPLEVHQRTTRVAECGAVRSIAVGVKALSNTSTHNVHWADHERRGISHAGIWFCLADVYCVHRRLDLRDQPRLAHRKGN